MDPFSDATLIA